MTAAPTVSRRVTPKELLEDKAHAALCRAHAKFIASVGGREGEFTNGYTWGFVDGYLAGYRAGKREGKADAMRACGWGDGGKKK